MFYENRLGIKKSVISFVYLFCPNTGSKFREPNHSNHVIPHRYISQVKIVRRWELWRWGGGWGCGVGNQAWIFSFNPLNGWIDNLQFYDFLYIYILFQSYQDDVKKII